MWDIFLNKIVMECVTKHTFFKHKKTKQQKITLQQSIKVS